MKTTYVFDNDKLITFWQSSSCLSNTTRLIIYMNITLTVKIDFESLINIQLKLMEISKNIGIEKMC